MPHRTVPSDNQGLHALAAGGLAGLADPLAGHSSFLIIGELNRYFVAHHCICDQKHSDHASITLHDRLFGPPSPPLSSPQL